MYVQYILTFTSITPACFTYVYLYITIFKLGIIFISFSFFLEILLCGEVLLTVTSNSLSHEIQCTACQVVYLFKCPIYITKDLGARRNQLFCRNLHWFSKWTSSANFFKIVDLARAQSSKLEAVCFSHRCLLVPNQPAESQRLSLFKNWNDKLNPYYAGKNKKYVGQVYTALFRYWVIIRLFCL